MHDYVVELETDTSALAATPGSAELVEVILSTATLTDTTGGVVSTIEIPMVGVQGPPGPPGGAGFTFHQTSPAATWLITHNLNKKPDLALFIDPNLTERVWTDVSYLDSNTLTVVWPSAVSGWAYI